jgi:quercetin dioxygenase-like cupin family protein
MPLRISFAGLLAALGLLAQSPSDVRVDTSQARAVVATLQPHQQNPAHEHPMNRVLVFLGPGRITLTNPAGKVEKIAFQAGDVRWSPAGAGNRSENTTDHAIQIVEIELKNKTPRPMPSTALDPPIVDPNHYKIELENEQVRVMRVRYGAHESGPKHEHILNRVVVNVTDQGNGKAGEVHVSGAMTHTEANSLEQPVERIAVELK